MNTDETNMEEIHNILKNKMVIMVTNDLTIGLTDNDKKPFTSNEIEKFIKENDDNMEIAIERMIYDYKEDGELELLKDPLNDWVGDYLYTYVDIEKIHNMEEIQNMEEIHNILKNQMVIMVTNDLTIFRTDNDKKPFTSNEIEKFIKENDDKIEKAIKDMICDYTIKDIICKYKNDGKLELLKEQLNEWFCYYLYMYVDIEDIYMFTDYK